MSFNITNEYDKLESVILGTADLFYQGERINEAMETFYGTNVAPTATKLQGEINRLKQVLEGYGIQVLQPQPSVDVPEQLTPRDVGFVVGDTFVYSNMARESRKKETLFIKNIVDSFNGRVLNTPKEVNLEGGNIVIDGNKLFVGIGMRTTENAVEFLQTQFGNKYKIIPVKLSDKEEIIHLDAVFNILDDGVAIVYSEGLVNPPKEILDYKGILITKEEKTLGGCNFLNIDRKTKIFREGLDNLIGKVKALGFDVETVPWEESKKTGTVGPRCATLPLSRLPSFVSI